LSEDLKTTPHKNSQKQIIQKTISELIDIKEKPEAAEEKLKELLTSLPEQSLMRKIAKSPVEIKSRSELLQLASRLEQIANTQEMLSRMNPVMQALGEPALLLFPFIFQGLLSHSKVSLESYQNRNKQNIDGEEEGQGGKQSSNYQRVQLSVPLPNLGSVDIDVAHRKEEIFVRMTLEDLKAGEFLISQMDLLGGILSELGYSTRELMTQVSETKEKSPDASRGSSRSSFVVA
jgi:hypothetical protein